MLPYHVCIIGSAMLAVYSTLISYEIPIVTNDYAVFANSDKLYGDIPQHSYCNRIHTKYNGHVCMHVFHSCDNKYLPRVHNTFIGIYSVCMCKLAAGCLGYRYQVQPV